MANIAGFELNGGFKKALIGTAVTLVTALGGYVLNASSKVEPLTVETRAIKDRVEQKFQFDTDKWNDQRSWNSSFVANQQRVIDKLDQLLGQQRK